MAPVDLDTQKVNGRRDRLVRGIGAAIVVALLAPATIAFAQSDVPDLKGSWSGEAEIVILSEVAEHVAPSKEPSFPKLDFTITVERQEGRGFAGTLASTRATDPLIGMLRADGRQIHMVDNDGTLTGELVGPNEMEVCRTEVTPDSMSVYCANFTREP
jgi:hypothetical protein